LPLWSGANDSIGGCRAGLTFAGLPLGSFLTLVACGRVADAPSARAWHVTTPEAAPPPGGREIVGARWATTSLAPLFQRAPIQWNPVFKAAAMAGTTRSGGDRRSKGEDPFP